MKTKQIIFSLIAVADASAMLPLAAHAQTGQRHRFNREFTTDTAMVHDPVMAYEDGMVYLFSTGRGVMTAPPAWTQTAVPGFRDHV